MGIPINCCCYYLSLILSLTSVVGREVDKYRFFYKPYFGQFEPLSTNSAAQIVQK